MITNAEISELETLLKEREIDISRQRLKLINEDTNPNYELLYNSINNQKYNELGELISGFRGCALEGSSRSGKTWSGVDIIIWLCLFIELDGCTINIYRETYNEFKTTLYDDFKRRLDDFGIPNPFHTAKEVKSFRIGKSTIYFLGDGKHGGGCDYAFFNEMMFIQQSVFDQTEMRCRKFWWADYNPSVTEHWFFDRVLSRPDVGFLKTVYQDNKHISFQEKNKILSYEPWLPGSYIVKDDVVLCYNKLTKKVEPISKTNHPKPHQINISNGTADEFMWKVYGLGLRGAMKGVIFNHVEWIDTFPKNIGHIFTNDFGFTTDPNALNKYGEDEHNIWIEPLCYEPIETAAELIEVSVAHGIKRNSDEFKRDGDLIICDSSDKYTGENKGTVEMVKALKKDLFNASKISKTMGVLFWLNSMKAKKIHIVKNHLYLQVKKEKENYRMKEINGIAINQPIDKWNHFWDSARYGHMAYNNKKEIHETEESLSEMGINY